MRTYSCTLFATRHEPAGLPAQGAFDTEILKVLGFYAEQRDSILGEVTCMHAVLGEHQSLQLIFIIFIYFTVN